MITYPALRARMGSWQYFIVRMSMRELAESVKLAHDVHEDKTLATAIQRVLREGRAHKDIICLKYQEDRFFGSIVVAALGESRSQPVNMQDQEALDSPLKMSGSPTRLEFWRSRSRTTTHSMSGTVSTRSKRSLTRQPEI